MITIELVKSQEIPIADAEYHVARYANYMHVKLPTLGLMSMRKKEGISLLQLLEKNNLSFE